MSNTTPIWPFGFFSARRPGERDDDYRRRLTAERKQHREFHAMTEADWDEVLNRFMERDDEQK